jgi:hypothetical protein
MNLARSNGSVKSLGSRLQEANRVWYLVIKLLRDNGPSSQNFGKTPADFPEGAVRQPEEQADKSIVNVTYCVYEDRYIRSGDMTSCMLPTNLAFIHPGLLQGVYIHDTKKTSWDPSQSVLLPTPTSGASLPTPMSGTV